jgi:hypothetical protein
MVLAGIGFLLTAVGWLVTVGTFAATYAMFAKSMAMNYPPEGRRPTAMWPNDDIPPSDK